MQDQKFHDLTIALAGIIQAASLVKELAQTGKVNNAAYQSSINSIFQTDPPDVLAVFGGDLSGVKFGLEKLVEIFDPSTVVNETRYMLAIMRLQKKISASKKSMDLLVQRLPQAKKQVEYFSLLHHTVISNLADIYLHAINSFKFRIIIWGNQRILTVPENMEKVRAILLAGVRSSVLWRQLGGSRLQLLFFRGKIREMARKILSGCEKTAVTENI